MKKTFITMFSLLIIILLSGCSEEKAKEYALKEATNVAVQSIQLNEHKDVVFTSHVFEQENNKSLIHLNGYEVNHPEIKRTVTIDYNDDFRIVYKQ